MRKLFSRILFLTISLGFTACGLFDDQSTPYGYVKSCFRKIDKYALYANGDWIIERESYLSEAKSIDSFEDAHRIVKSALAFAGGTMLYVISDEMIPETHAHGNERGATYSLLVGFCLMLAVDFLLG